ncbi:MAG: (d)CMP kinase [Planctomycetaceae bacterium]
MIVTLDGPAGSGKSKAAEGLAVRLGWLHLNTGAMYRAVTLAALRRGLDLADGAALAALAASDALTFRPGVVLIDDAAPGEELRSHAVNEAIKRVADWPAVRAALVARQQRIAHDVDLVTEGRDQGTVVFPQAELKVYLTASREVRAARRFAEERERRPGITLAAVLAEQDRRDVDDRSRAVGALRMPADAVELDTDHLSREAVVDRLVALVAERRHGRRER